MNRPMTALPCFATIVSMLAAALVSADEQRATNVGVVGQINQLVLPGTELEVTPNEDNSPIVIRIAAVYPHGSAFRYDLVYFGLEPGEYDLGDYLRRKDGGSADDLPEIPIQVEGLLASGQIEPHELRPRATRFLGGYRAAIVIGSALWIAGLLAILLVGRRRLKQGNSADQPRPSLATTLRPMVRQAIDGTLSPRARAELERLLMEYWRRRRQLDGLPAAEAVRQLREDAEAGALLRQLERWLHQPPAVTGEPIDLESLLKPYEDTPDLMPAASRGDGS